MFLGFVLGLASVWCLSEPLQHMRAAVAHSAAWDVLSRQRHSWNEGDLEGFMNEYWKSDDLTFYSGGTVTKGWQATFDRYRKRYQAEGAEMGELEFTDIEVKVISHEAALARGRWE